MVRGKRSQLRLRQVDLARLAGVSVDTIRALLSGTKSCVESTNISARGVAHFLAIVQMAFSARFSHNNSHSAVRPFAPDSQARWGTRARANRRSRLRADGPALSPAYEVRAPHGRWWLRLVKCSRESRRDRVGSGADEGRGPCDRTRARRGFSCRPSRPPGPSEDRRQRSRPAGPSLPRA